MKTTIALLSLSIAGSASGAIITFSSRPAFTAAASGLTTIDFGTAAPPPAGFYTSYPAGLILSGATFSNTTPGARVDIVSRTYCCATYARGFDQLDTGNGSGINIALPTGTVAIGFDLFTVASGNVLGTNQDKVDVTLGGQTFVFTSPMAPGTTFAGFISTTPISNVTIAAEPSGGAAPQVDMMNVAFGGAAPTPASVPEPASGPLVAAAVLGLAFRIISAARKKNTPRS